MKSIVSIILCIVLGIWIQIHFPKEAASVGQGVKTIFSGLVQVVHNATK